MMNKSFTDMCDEIRAVLRKRWRQAASFTLLCECVLFVLRLIPQFGNFADLLLFPLNIGLLFYFLQLTRREYCSVEMLFVPFRSYGRWVWGAIRFFIFTFLWTLLCIVPGVIAAFRYSQTFYIMLDHPEMTVKEAMNASCQMMRGHKGRLFLYTMLFLLAAVVELVIVSLAIFALHIASASLCQAIITFVLTVTLTPWMYTFFSCFYCDLIEDQGTEGKKEADAEVVEN